MHILHARNHAGYLLTDMLVVIGAVCALIPAASSCIALLPQLLAVDENVQDEIAAAQLRRILMLAYDPCVSSDTLSFTYQGKEMALYETNGHLILTPGTQIFFSEIDSASFEESGEVIYVILRRKNTERRCPLMHA